MVSFSRSPDVDSFGSNLGRIVCDYRTPADAINLTQNVDMESYFAALRVTNSWQKAATRAPRDAARKVPEKEIENELDTSEGWFTPAFKTMYAKPQDVQHINEASLKDQDECKLQRLIDDSVNEKAPHVFKDAHEKALKSAYNELYQIVETAAAKAIYLEGADDQSNEKVVKLAEFQQFT